MLRRTVTVIAALSFACSLTSLDGFTGGGTSDPPDAESGVGEATVDAATDALLVGEADAAKGPFCSSAPAGAFCDDFEDGLSKWVVDVTGDGNSVVIDDATSVSASHSAFSTAATYGSSCLSRSFSGSPQIIEVDADVNFESTAVSGSGYDFLKLAGSTLHNLSIQLRGGIVELDEDIVPLTDGGPDERIASTDYALEPGWHHFRWTSHLSVSTADVELFVDGIKVGSLAADALDFAAPVRFQLGDCTNSLGDSAWKVHFDNVVIVTK